MKAKYFAAVMLISALVLAGNSCSKSNNSSNQYPAGNGNSVSVNIASMAFPPTITIKVGQTVVWNNQDAFAHTVTSDDGTTFNSGNVAAGASYSYTATKAGTFAYHCNIHSNMHGTLVVTA